jgi:thiamine biosynthesis lipoprotein
VTESSASRRVIEVMGTVFSLELVDVVPEAVLGAVEADLRWVDEVFSTYRADSALSRLASGRVSLCECPVEVGEVLDLCAVASVQTDWWFSAMAAGKLDPTGLVKGWAIRRVDAILRGAGSARHAINGGGDVLLGTSRGPGVPWTVGIADPRDPARLLATVKGAEMAVATSGTAERGAHILDPFTGAAADQVLSATVVGADIVDADAYATAAVAMGPAAIGWLQTVAGYDALLVTAAGQTLTTDQWQWPVTEPRLSHA